MSIPPQLIRVKRKRDDESPVTFLQFDEGAKRHRTGSNWVYQRRHADPQSPTEAPARSFHDVKPVIHVSGPDGDAPRTKAKVAVKAPAPPSTASSLNTAPADDSKLAEPRRFHISKKMMMTATGNQSSIPGMKKKGRYGPAVFVERGRVKASQRASRALEAMRASATPPPDQQQQDATAAVDQKATEPRLKKPGVRSRQRSPMPDPNARAPLPVSAMNPHNQDMSRIAADMNDWVMKEIGANLEQMENEKRKAVQHRFKPKTPTKSYAERHPEVVASTPEPNQMDTAMSDASDMDDDDWVIEEYVRVPAHAMMVNVAPADVGVLVLDGEEDNTLFFGPENDEDEELDEDDEDENAENYYTADYPEDEVESDDEYGRRPYGYRNGNASDDEEFDNMDYDDDDDDMVLEGNGDDDATMARIKNYVRRSHAFQ
ncbi:Iwr1 domain-containing protein [Fusarium keratoplasticum]|uniref:Iwr1 domain-containing protein n=1 Tax=Fusarium keratoplasticum TaxID=1328300 RepID=A0ACC0R0Y3_9HYPO|nr:Iwr1 domain-containing protein [Fusarium keratoplasticum]KAI8671363.1 Iwr1 domain-containing protein [Fusarium keratoplasticum]